MKIIPTTLLLTASVIVFAQDKEDIYEEALQLQVGYSMNGTADMKGGSFNVNYKQYFRRHFYFNAGVGATVHNDQFGIFYYNSLDHYIDGSVRYTTGGMQAFGGIGYCPIRTPHSELELRLNALVRYQASSLSDIIAVDLPAGTGLPYPVVELYNTSKARTVSVGGLLQLGYNYAIGRKTYLGLAASYQTDSESDGITDFSVTIGRRF